VKAPISIAVAQPAIFAHDLPGNVERHAGCVRRAGSRIVVFPELSLTGYDFTACSVEPFDDALRPLIDACRDSGSIALAGAPVRDPRAGRSIGVLRVDGDGAGVVYRKMWLGDAERSVFQPGAAPAVLEVDGWRIGLAVCKDTGVPQHAADTVALGIDVYVAGVLEHATDRDVQPRRAQRIIADHGVWVAMASFAGSSGEGFDLAAGESTIWRPNGTVAAGCGAAPGEIATATIR
jgi:predicted amidohydrolase